MSRQDQALEKLFKELETKSFYQVAKEMDIHAHHLKKITIGGVVKMSEKNLQKILETKSQRISRLEIELAVLKNEQ